MKNVEDGALRRVIVDDQSEPDTEDELSLGDLSQEDLEDSEEELRASSDSDSDGESETRNNLAEIPFETLVRARPQPVPRDAASNSQDKLRREEPKTSVQVSSVRGKRKRDNKHAPMEMSSKRPVGRGREAVEVVKIERRDPRFDPVLGEKVQNTSLSRKAYGFLEDYKKDEMRILKETIKKEKDVHAKAKLEKALSSMQSREQAAKERERRERVLSEYKRKERDAAKDGKIPYHLKASEQNKLYLKDKYDSIKDSKALDSLLERKRKRRSQKDRKRALPQ